MFLYQRTPIRGWLMLNSSFMGIKKKRGSLYLLLVPRIRGSCIALSSWTSNAEAHAEYAYCIAALTAIANLHIPHRTSTVASFLTTNLNLQDSWYVKNKASSKRLFLCHVFPAMHPTTVSSGLLPKNNRKYTHYFTILSQMIAIFYSKMEKNTILLMFQTSQYSFILFLTCWFPKG